MQALKYRTIENTIHGYSILAGFEGTKCISKAYIDADALFLNSIVIERVSDMLVMAYAVYGDGSIHGLTLVHIAFVQNERSIFKKLQDAINKEFALTYSIEAIDVDDLIAKILA